MTYEEFVETVAQEVHDDWQNGHKSWEKTQESLPGQADAFRDMAAKLWAAMCDESWILAEKTDDKMVYVAVERVAAILYENWTPASKVAFHSLSSETGRHLQRDYRRKANRVCDALAVRGCQWLSPSKTTRCWASRFRWFKDV